MSTKEGILLYIQSLKHILPISEVHVLQLCGVYRWRALHVHMMQGEKYCVLYTAVHGSVPMVLAPSLSIWHIQTFVGSLEGWTKLRHIHPLQQTGIIRLHVYTQMPVGVWLFHIAIFI